jgi:nucleolar protein 58
MEVMWGMKHLMHKLVPEEKSQLSMEDRLPMSQGLQILLCRYGFIVKPEMVSSPITMLLYSCLSFSV